MANRSDRHLANLSNSQGTKARSPDQEKVRGFPSWPVAQCGSFKRPDTRPQPEDQSKAATLRTGLGPYTTVRIQLAPPDSPPKPAEVRKDERLFVEKTGAGRLRDSQT